MKDQIDTLNGRGIAAARLDSTLDLASYRQVMEGVRSGDLRLLYVAPERFNNERFLEAIASVQIALFAVDEAHCISEWGHNFRPDYLKLAKFARSCGAKRVLALTATATEQVLTDVCEGLDIAPDCAVRTGFYRPNLHILTTPVRGEQRDSALLEALNQSPPGPTIVYVTLQRTAETVAKSIAQSGLPARAYHAGMKDEERASVQDWFMSSERAVVVATIAFGMGVDKSNIRYVYHYNLPKSLEHYSQEIGRAGRDGQTAICRMLVCADDLNVLENFVYGDTPDPAAVRGLLRELFSLGRDFDISLHALSQEHDVRPLVLRTLLTYLELQGWLEAGTPFYAEYKFRPLQSSGEILGRFAGERRQFLADLFRQARKGRVWLRLDPEAAARALDTDRQRVVRALDWLGEQGMLEVQPAGVRNRFRRLRAPDDPAALADELHGYHLRRESAEIGRLQQVMELAGRDGCQTAELATHFGESLAEPCGHCSWCLGGPTPVPERASPPITPGLAGQVEPLLKEPSGPLAHPRALARFLCGISSPRLARARLTRHPLFGSLVQVPFREVLAWAERFMGVLAQTAENRQ
jgi:ATP-dependent DNA helicase RecQ